MRKIVTSIIAGLTLSFANILDGQSNSELPEIRKLYDRTLGTNQFVGSQFFKDGGKTYHVIAFKDKDKTKTLEIEVHVKSSLERKFIDKNLDGLIEYDPNTLLIGEKKEFFGKVKEYSFKPVKNPLQYMGEYTNIVNKLLSIK